MNELKQNQVNAVYMRMVEFNANDPARIQHFIKVHSFAKLIGEKEGLEEKERYILETAALVHDIGIRPAEEKYGSCNGKLQEEVGPSYARDMLGELEFPEDVVERVCYLVAHHHTYSNVDGLDYRILLEADFLVNLFEDSITSIEAKSALKQSVSSARMNIFRTDTGIQILDTMFLANED